MSEYDRLKKQFDEIKESQETKRHNGCKDALAMAMQELTAARGEIGELKKFVAFHCQNENDFSVILKKRDEEIARLKAEVERAKAIAATLIKALNGMQEFHDCMEAQRKDEPMPEGHNDDDSGCGDGICYVVGKIIERGVKAAREALSQSSPSAEGKKVKEDFFCCKDQDNPCHPIGDYCSTGRSRIAEGKDGEGRR